MVIRIVDAPRPLVWSLGRWVQPYYRAQWEMRDLPDWQRIGIRRSHLNTQHGFLYLQAPKAASSSVKRFIMQWLNPGIADFPERGIPGTISGPLHWQTILPHLTSSATYRFSTCVHPVNRALAVFDHLFVRANHAFSRRHWPYNWKVGLKFRQGDGKNFDRFLDYVEDVHAQSSQFCDPHFRLQSKNLLLDHLKLDRIVRVENLEAEINRVAIEIGFTPLPDQAFARERQAGKRIEKYSRLSHDQVRRIFKLYEEDFDRLGYPMIPADWSGGGSRAMAIA